MKRQTLQIGSALLATTALSSIATAGTIETASNTASASAAITPVSLATQVFGATGAANVTLGPIGVNLDFTNALTSSFDVDLESTNGKFSTASGPVAIIPFLEDASASILQVSYLTASQCTVQVLTERILVDNCVSTQAAAACRIDVVQLSGIVFNQANGLATAGTSLSLGGIVTGNTGNQTFELISSANVITSANALTTTVTTGGTGGSFTINNTATPPFSKITPSATAAVIGTVTVTPTNAVGTNLTTVLSIASNLASGMEFTITHGVLSDPAFTEIHLSSANTGLVQSIRAGSFGTANTASFDQNTANTQRGTFDIEVNFNGSTAISNWSAGSVTVTYTAGTQVVSAPATATGTLAAFNQGGFRAQINTAQSSAVSGFDSFVRITNNGSVAGFALIAVADDADGSVYGTYTTATVQPNATIQISMPTIEASVVAVPKGQYMLNITGALSGYAQHVMLNTQNGTFVDMSGFRIGDATNGFP